RLSSSCSFLFIAFSCHCIYVFCFLSPTLVSGCLRSFPTRRSSDLMVLMPLLSRLLTLLVILTMPLFLARLTLIPIKSVVLTVGRDRKSGSAGMPRPISYAVFCLKKKKKHGCAQQLHDINHDRAQLC